MHKIIAIIACFATTGLIAPAGLGQWTGSIAIAGEGGGEGGGFANGGQQRKKANKAKAPKKAAKKADTVPNTDAIRAPKGNVRRIQDRLEDHARKDNLRGLATSRKRMAAFKRDLDKTFRAAKSTKQQMEANRIYTQLQRYKSQKTNKALRVYADAVLDGLAVLKALDEVKARQAAHKKAQKTKGVGDDIETKVDLDDAVEDYNLSRARVHKAIRGIYPTVR